MDEEDHDPIQWSNQAMRIQLWDTFRLARIILGEPVKTKRLTSHLILHAIRKVAEMKLQISMLQKEMNDQFFEARAAAEASAALVRETPKLSMTALETVPETSEAYMSPSTAHLVTPTSEARGHHFHYESSSDDDDLEDIFDETSEDMEHYERASAAIKSKPSLESTNTPTTWGSSVDSEGVVHLVVGEEQEAHHVSALRREILSQPLLKHPSRHSSPEPAYSPSLSSKPTADEFTKLLKLQSQKQHKEIESMLHSLDCKVQETSALTSSQIKALHAKLADAQSQQAAALREQEQRLQRVGSRPTPNEARVETASTGNGRHASSTSREGPTNFNAYLGTDPGFV
jgi:hypothetical protein